MSDIKANYEAFYIYLKDNEVIGFLGFIAGMENEKKLKKFESTKNVTKICSL